MSLLDIFKKKKKPAKKTPEKEPVKAKVTEKPKPKVPVKPKTKISAIAYRVLKEPHVTEKATDLVKHNQYVFKIWPRTNKIEVKKAVEDLYGVEVKGVKIIRVPRKRRRLGRIQGWRKGYKKAIVKLKEGEKIEVLPR